MKTDVYKAKNSYDEYTGQLDRGETQIIVIAKTAKERNRLVKEARKIIRG